MRTISKGGYPYRRAPFRGGLGHQFLEGMSCMSRLGETSFAPRRYPAHRREEDMDRIGQDFQVALKDLRTHQDFQVALKRSRIRRTFS